jgi:hypothetical protein
VIDNSSTPGGAPQPRETRAGTPVARRRTVLAAATTLTLVIALSVLAWVWRHPHAFADADGSIGQVARAWPVGKSIYVGVTYGDPKDTITLEDAEPVVERNSARAEIKHFICIPVRPGGGSIGSVDEAGAEEHCAMLEPVDGTPITWESSENPQVLMRITPTTEGVIEVPSSELTYRDGWRVGSQRVGDGIRIRALLG